jgi:hypothetical protein
LLSIYVGTTPLPSVEFDYVITSAEQFAPDCFIRMTADRRIRSRQASTAP